MMGCSKDKAEVQDNNKPKLTSQENIYSRNNVGNNRAETEQSNYPAFNEINNNMFMFMFLIISSSRFMINNLFGLNKLFTFLGFELQKVF